MFPTSAAFHIFLSVFSSVVVWLVVVFLGHVCQMASCQTLFLHIFTISVMLCDVNVFKR